MKRITVVSLLVALVVAASAHAKGPVSATVCGANGCNEVEQGRQLQLFTDSQGPTGPPTSATGWYRARLAFGEPGEPVQEPITVAVIPDRRLMRWPGERWNPISEEAAQAFTAATADLKALPPSELGLKAAPASQPAAAPAADDGAGGDGGTPWVAIVAAAIVIALAAVALIPPVRRRLTARFASP